MQLQLGTYQSPYLIYASLSGTLMPPVMQRMVDYTAEKSRGEASYHLLVDMRGGVQLPQDVASLAEILMAGALQCPNLGWTTFVAPGCTLAPVTQVLRQQPGLKLRVFDVIEDAIIYLCAVDRRLPPMLPFKPNAVEVQLQRQLTTGTYQRL